MVRARLIGIRCPSAAQPRCHSATEHRGVAFRGVSRSGPSRAACGALCPRLRCLVLLFVLLPHLEPAALAEQRKSEFRPVFTVLESRLLKAGESTHNGQNSNFKFRHTGIFDLLAFRQHGQVRRYGSRAQANSIFPERLIVGITRPPLPALLRSLSVAPGTTEGVAGVDAVGEVALE
jgi:hypothetical protein